MSFLAIYITTPNKEEASRIAQDLVSRRLVACANIFPIQSMYWWTGAVQQEGEFVALVKSRITLWDKIVNHVRSIHPYEVPCIMKIKVEANAEYEAWIQPNGIAYA